MNRADEIRRKNIYEQSIAKKKKKANRILILKVFSNKLHTL
jgi:hypothetical protein